MLEHLSLLLVVAYLLAWLSFGLLAMSQERHFAQFYTSFRPAAQFIRVRAAIIIIAITAAAGIFAALLACIAAQGAGFGSLLWLLILSASAMTVALQLTWASHTLKPLAWLVRRLFHACFSVNLPR